VTGRFQPVHNGHLELFELALAQSDRLVLAVTNPDRAARAPETSAPHRHLDEANPFTYYERCLLLRTAIAAAGWECRVLIVPFDLTRPETWTDYVPSDATQFVRSFGVWEDEKARRLADAGYRTKRIRGNPNSVIRASEVRALLRAGTGWERLVPEAIVPLLRRLCR
jgi:nicotinamide-nucleotide adenylyltransferase